MMKQHGAVVKQPKIFVGTQNIWDAELHLYQLLHVEADKILKTYFRFLFTGLPSTFK